MLYKKDSLAKVVNTIVHLFDDIKAKVNRFCLLEYNQSLIYLK